MMRLISSTYDLNSIERNLLSVCRGENRVAADRTQLSLPRASRVAGTVRADAGAAPPPSLANATLGSRIIVHTKQRSPDKSRPSNRVKLWHRSSSRFSVFREPGS